MYYAHKVDHIKGITLDGKLDLEVDADIGEWRLFTKDSSRDLFASFSIFKDRKKYDVVIYALDPSHPDYDSRELLALELIALVHPREEPAQSNPQLGFRVR